MVQFLSCVTKLTKALASKLASGVAFSNPVAAQLALVISELQSDTSTVATIAPHSLMTAIHAIKDPHGLPMFPRLVQSDAGEVLTYLLDALHIDLPSITPRRPFIEPFAEAANQGWTDHCKLDSVVTDHLWGLQCTVHRCDACRHERPKCTPIGHVALAFPPPSPSLSSEPSATTLDLRDLLARHTKTEVLDDYTCGQCCVRGRTTGRVSFHTLPPDVLIIQLSRSVHLKDAAGVIIDTQKIQTKVDVPLAGLDMGIYMTQPDVATSSDAGAATGVVDGGIGSAANTPARTRCVYDLDAVVNHSGTSMDSGHYTTACRWISAASVDGGRWLSFDDAAVTWLHDARVITQQAYILMFTLRKVTDPNML